MASFDPEFYDAPKYSGDLGEPRSRQRGCFFYGCVISCVVAVLIMIALAVGAFILMRFFSGVVEQWTSPTPMELPKVEIPDEARQSVRQRIDAFRSDVEAGTATEALVLTSDDLNALIEENPDLKGKIFAKIDGEKLKAQVSFPLDRFGIGMLQGRYLNGEAELKASLENGVLVVMLESLEVNGKRPPENFLQGLKNQNLARDAYSNPKNAALIARFESLQIKDGKIILKPRPRAPQTEDKKTDTKKLDPPAEASDDDLEEPDTEKSEQL